jgi:hypothetical protein
VTITPAQFVAFQAMLVGDEETFKLLTAAADFHEGEGFSVLIASAFFAAAQRHFPPGWTHADVVRFVGHLRAGDGEMGETLSPTAAEQMLLTALTGAPMAGMFDENAKALAQIVLLAGLVSDLNAQDRYVFSAEARERTDAWMAQHNLQ